MYLCTFAYRAGKCDQIPSGHRRRIVQTLTSQKNSFPLSPQNQEIHDTSSELLMSEDLQTDTSRNTQHLINTHTFIIIYLLYSGPRHINREDKATTHRQTFCSTTIMCNVDIIEKHVHEQILKRVLIYIKPHVKIQTIKRETLVQSNRLNLISEFITTSNK